MTRFWKYHGIGNDFIVFDGTKGDKALHLFFFVLRFHASMNLAESEFREGFFQYLETIF